MDFLRKSRAPTALKAAVLLAFSAVVFSGCSDDDDDPAPAASVTWTLVATDAAGGTTGVIEQQDGNPNNLRISGEWHGGINWTDDYAAANPTVTDPMPNVYLDAAHTWFLQGVVFIGDDSTANEIEIEAGTTVKGLGGSVPGTLVIRRHSDITAIGTADNPIVFTSYKNPGSRAPGDWGGLVINGLSHVNEGTAASPPVGEGGSGKYGGFAGSTTHALDTADSSGTLQYVRVEYAGHLFTSENELNGIAFQAVGSGTTIDHIQVHRNADDGVEFFGGTAEAKYVVLTGCEDDSLDWTYGWQGKMQYVLIQHYSGSGDQGIEADNNGGTNTATPTAEPWLANLTIVGDGTATTSSDIGALLREGTQGHIANTLIAGFEQGIDIDQNDTWDKAFSTNYTVLSGNLTAENVYVYDNATAFEDDGDPTTVANWASLNTNVVETTTNPFADAAYNNQTSPDTALEATGAAASVTWPTSWTDGFFDDTTYAGCFDPSASTSWLRNSGGGLWITTDAD